jgi:hypothetical protein
MLGIALVLQLADGAANKNDLVIDVTRSLYFSCRRTLPISPCRPLFADVFGAFGRGTANAGCLQPLSPALLTFKSCSRVDRIIAFRDLACDVGINLRFNESWSVIPHVEGLGEIGISLDVTPNRGGVERFVATEPGAQLRDLEPAESCWFEISHCLPRVATRDNQTQSLPNQQTLRPV